MRSTRSHVKKRTVLNKCKVNIKAVRLECFKLKSKPHLMLPTADVFATAVLKTTDHDVIKRMGCRVEMFGNGKTRRVVSNTTEVLTESFP